MKSILIFLLILPLAVRAQMIVTFAGNGVDAHTGDGGPATAAAIGAPGGIFIDPVGDIYFTSFSKHTLRKISTSGIITTICGNGTAGSTGDGGPASAARLYNPTKICRDGDGNIYITDRGNHKVRKISAAGIITTIAGTGTPGYMGDGGPATLCRLNTPTGICVDNAGNVYVADVFNHRVRKISPSGIITTIAGNGIPTSTGDGGLATAATLNNPHDVDIDASGNLLIAEPAGNRIRKINTSGIMSTVAGTGAAGYGGDGGTATTALLNNPAGIALDGAGNLYIADQFNQVTRKISASGIISTVAGNTVAGYSGDGGPATAASFNYSNEICVSSTGKLYINDNNNYRIRTIEMCSSLVATHPVNDTGVTGDTLTFNVTSSIPSPFYQWQADTGTGFYNLPVGLPYAGVNTSTLTIYGVDTTMDSTFYRCVITSGETGGCSETSNAAILRVNEPIATGMPHSSVFASATIWPNPMGGYVYIDPGMAGYVHIVVQSTTGAIVYDATIEGKTRINTEHLSQGIYVVRMQHDGDSAFFKMVKL